MQQHVADAAAIKNDHVDVCCEEVLGVGVGVFSAIKLLDGKHFCILYTWLICSGIISV